MAARKTRAKAVPSPSLIPYAGKPSRGGIAAKAKENPKDPSTYTTIYGTAIIGDCMAPEYPHGSFAMIDPTIPYGPGDVVVVWFRPELVKKGHAPGMIKRIVMVAAPWVKGYPYQDHPQSEVRAVIYLGRDDRPDEMFAVECSKIQAIHKCIGPLDPERISKDYRSAAQKKAHRAGVPT